jgi:hypothetical protein
VLLVAFVLGSRGPSLLGLGFVAIATPVYFLVRRLGAGAGPLKA